MGQKKSSGSLLIPEKFMIIDQSEWKIVDFNTNIKIMYNCILNLEKLLIEEEISF